MWGNRNCARGVFVGGFLLCLSGAAAAEKLFSSEIAWGTDVGKVGTNSLREVPDIYDSNSLEKLFPGFNPGTDNFVSSLNLRGVHARITFDSGNQELRVEIPGVIDELRFDEGSLDDDLDALRDWFKGDWDTSLAPNDAVNKVLQAWVANSPVEPVAGNPNSLMTSMVSADFRLGGEGPFLHGDGPLDSAPGQTGITLDYGYSDAEEWSVNRYTLELGHRFNFASLPNLSVLVSFPLTGTQTEGSWTGLGSLGLGVQYRPTRRWALTPMIRVGVVGSLNVGAAAMMATGTLTSHAGFSLREFSSSLPDIQLGLTNQLGYAQSIDNITIGDYRLDYELENGVFRNGGYFAGRFDSSAFGWKLFGNATHWVGDDLYLESYAELGGELYRLGEVAGQPFEQLSLSLSYMGDFGNWDSMSVGMRGRF